MHLNWKLKTLAAHADGVVGLVRRPAGRASPLEPRLHPTTLRKVRRRSGNRLLRSHRGALSESRSQRPMCLSVLCSGVRPVSTPLSDDVRECARACVCEAMQIRIILQAGSCRMSARQPVLIAQSVRQSCVRAPRVRASEGRGGRPPNSEGARQQTDSADTTTGRHNAAVRTPPVSIPTPATAGSPGRAAGRPD